MKVLGIQIGRSAPDQPTAPPAGQAIACLHEGLLVPHWTDLAAMGHADKAAYYICESCRATLSPAEAERVRSKVDQDVQRLRAQTLEGDTEGTAER